MALDIMKEKGVPLDTQLLSFNWRDMVQSPVSKLDDDAFTKVKDRPDERDRVRAVTL